MSVVVDASFTARTLLPGPLQSECQAKLADWRERGVSICAPTLWLYEVTSLLSKAVRFGDLSVQRAESVLTLALDLDLTLTTPDRALAEAAFHWTHRLNRGAAYDSFYVALAEGLNCELWTADERLQNAVGVAWVRRVGKVGG